MKFKINKALILQKMDNKLIGFDVDKSLLYTFNETAEFIFKKIKAGWDVEKIIDALLKIHEIDETTLKKDVNALISDMKKNRIIVPVRSTP